MSTELDELASTQVRMKKDGTLIQRIDGSEVPVAKYDRNTGHLEFETKEHSVKLYNQVTAKIGTVKNGTEPSGMVIKSIGVKGQAKPSGNLYKRPKMGPEGDGTPALVDWFIHNNLSEAIIRYQIVTDKDGNPVRKRVRRVIERTVDRRDLDDEDLPWIKSGKKTQEKAAVARDYELVELKSAIIARRGTRYEEGLEALFTPQEVVGGFEIEDSDFESGTEVETEEAE